MSWLLLRLELRRWRAAGRKPVLWWRDDDARAPSAELDRLLDLAARHATPLTLAVIPDGDITALAARLGDTGQVCVAQHGIDHQNRRTGPAAGEFPPEWRRIRVATQLRAGWARLAQAPQAARIFVPPWNDIHPELACALEDCGYRGWSAWGEMASPGQAPRVDAHLDLMRWRGGARFRGEGRFLSDLTAQLASRRRSGAWSAPIGLLTHHLVHDARAWSFLETFLGWSRGQGGMTWNALPDLLAAAGH
ncbi:polysaccharide deacetylase family protein [Phenylobacterium aquaticum]|uniref:polysaccharide deacetylase family protein n=1 Tax=Phenylobacterium aquaticum TaxID=1763816 RepID=UPI0026EBBFD9|nr:polysaccharide deacetylase family protein [Phenylobacterium aquaticum]